MRKFIKYLIVIVIVLVLSKNDIKAINAPGYIISIDSDTIYGTINLQKFNQLSGGYIINGFDLESLFSIVYFKSYNDKRYKRITPDKISGFGFFYNSTDYFFKSFRLDHKSLIKKERHEYTFLYLIHSGQIDLYERIKSIPPISNNSLSDTHMVLYDFYLYNVPTGLVKVEQNDSIKTIKDLLKPFALDQEFIDDLPEDAKFKEIKRILESYDIKE